MVTALSGTRGSSLCTDSGFPKPTLPDIRFHDLHQSSATMLLSLGVHPKVVQEILGHSQISMTMDIYSLVLPTMQQEAMRKLNDALGG